MQLAAKVVAAAFAAGATGVLGTNGFGVPPHDIAPTATGLAKPAAGLAAPARGTWGAYGADAGGQRYSDASQISPANISSLEQAWVFRTGELGEGYAMQKKMAFEATPVLLGHTLYLSTPTGVVYAVDAVAGVKRWRFDAQMDPSIGYAAQTSRGVATWIDPAAQPNAPCAQRVFFASLDARLFALDAATGARCNDFGENGEVALYRNIRLRSRSDYNMTSPPVVIGDTIVVGSSIGDNRGTDLELGAVRAFGARRGETRWQWDPIPRTAVIPADAANPEFTEVDAQTARWTGAANAWAPLSADPEHNVVFVPTGSASPDFFGGERLGDNHWANSVVALDALDGHPIWGKQLVHHDLWDYDVASQPVATTIAHNGQALNVIIQATKTGQIFVLDRATGASVFPIQERAVPQDAVPGERPSPTQPFSSLPPLVPHRAVKPEDAWGFTFWDRSQCARKIAQLHSEGIFTPPSVQGTIQRPGYGGGSDWGGIAFDPVRQLVIANVTDLPMVVTLVPRKKLAAMADSDKFPNSEFARQLGTPYGMRREMLASSLGAPCTAPPWGKLVALDIRAGKIRWQRPLGTSRDTAPWPLWGVEGVPNTGGPAVTASGLIFIGAAVDNYVRAFSTDSGTELWKARLPAGGQATPMTYAIDGKQYVVIAAGGHGGYGTKQGDYLIAYALRNSR